MNMPHKCVPKLPLQMDGEIYFHDYVIIIEYIYIKKYGARIIMHFEFRIIGKRV